MAQKTLAARLMDFADSAKEAEMYARAAIHEVCSGENPLDPSTGCWTFSMKYARQARSDAASLEKSVTAETVRLDIARRLTEMEKRLRQSAEVIAAEREELVAVSVRSYSHRQWEVRLIDRRDAEEEMDSCPNCGRTDHYGCDPEFAEALLFSPGGPWEAFGGSQEET